MPAQPRLTQLVLVLCAIALPLALAACGGSGNNATAAQDNEQKLVKFAKCMREHGVNVSTPTSGTIRITGRGGDASCGRPSSAAGEGTVAGEASVRDQSAGG